MSFIQRYGFDPEITPDYAEPRGKIPDRTCGEWGIPPIFAILNGFAMFEFDQYLGFLAFLTIVTIGFWLMIFLLAFVVPYWLGGNLIELWKERREARRARRE